MAWNKNTTFVDFIDVKRSLRVYETIDTAARKMENQLHHRKVSYRPSVVSWRRDASHRAHDDDTFFQVAFLGCMQDLSFLFRLKLVIALWLHRMLFVSANSALPVQLSAVIRRTNLKISEDYHKGRWMRLLTSQDRSSHPFATGQVNRWALQKRLQEMVDCKPSISESFPPIQGKSCNTKEKNNPSHRWYFAWPYLELFHFCFCMTVNTQNCSMPAIVNRKTG